MKTVIAIAVLSITMFVASCQSPTTEPATVNADSCTVDTCKMDTTAAPKI